MTTQATPKRIIVLNGKKMTLVFDVNAATKFEEVTGKNVNDPSVWANPSATTIRAMIWCMLLDENPSITLEEVGKLLTPENMIELTRQMGAEVHLDDPEKTETAN